MADLEIRPQQTLHLTSSYADVVHEKEDGSVSTFLLSSNSQKKWDLQFSLLNATDYNTLVSLWESKKRVTGFTWLHPKDSQTYVVKFSEVPTFEIKSGNIYSASIKITYVLGPYTPWVTAFIYEIGDYVYNNSNYFYCYTAHNSNSDREPGIGPDWEDYWSLIIV